MRATRRGSERQTVAYKLNPACFPVECDAKASLTADENNPPRATARSTNRHAPSKGTFPTAWFCWRLLPEKLIFVEVDW